MTVHLFEVGKADHMPTRLAAASLADLSDYLRRRTGRADAEVLARLAWHGGRVQIGALILRGWTVSDVSTCCSHCGRTVGARAITCRDEVEEAGLAVPLGDDTDVISLGLVFPTGTCEACGENISFARS